MPELDWYQVTTGPPRRFRCGHCGHMVAPNKHYYPSNFAGDQHRIYICSGCNFPTFFDGQRQYPGVAFGNDVEHLPDDIGKLYREARRCISVEGHTSCVMACRKLIMHVAVAQGANPGLSFIQYVEWLDHNKYLPPGGKDWVDLIRTKGNEANHEIRIMQRSEAEQLVTFLEMLLKFIYEFPAKVKPPTPVQQTT